jgi:hypothetical protein
MPEPEKNNKNHENGCKTGNQANCEGTDTQKDTCISQNHALMQTAAQLGSIMVAVIAILFGLFGTYPEFFLRVETNLILFIFATSAASFFAATTFYLRGSNAIKDCEFINYHNNKGDTFFATGLMGLFLIPILLFHALNLYVAMFLTCIALIVIFTHMFMEHKIGIVAIRVSLLGIVGKDNHENTRGTTDFKNIGNILILTLFYLFMGLCIAEALFKSQTGTSLLQVLFPFWS